MILLGWGLYIYIYIYILTYEFNEEIFNSRDKVLRFNI
jgi:hypothetical protein